MNVIEPGWKDTNRETPDVAGIYAVELIEGGKADLGFYGKGLGWEGGAEVAKWYATGATPKPMSAAEYLSPQLIQVDEAEWINMDDFIPVDGSANFDDQDKALDFDAVSLISGFERSMLNIEVEVFRTFLVAKYANSTVAGTVLAVGSNFAAQHVGGGNLVVHELSRLEGADLTPGQDCTVSYRDGHGVVYEGLPRLEDVRLAATDNLTAGQITFLQNELRGRLPVAVDRMTEAEVQVVVDVAVKAFEEKYQLKVGTLTVNFVDRLEEKTCKALDAIWDDFKENESTTMRVTHSMRARP